MFWMDKESVSYKTGHAAGLAGNEPELEWIATEVARKIVEKPKLPVTEPQKDTNETLGDNYDMSSRIKDLKMIGIPKEDIEKITPTYIAGLLDLYDAALSKTATAIEPPVIASPLTFEEPKLPVTEPSKDAKETLGCHSDMFSTIKDLESIVIRVDDDIEGMLERARIIIEATIKDNYWEGYIDGLTTYITEHGLAQLLDDCMHGSKIEVCPGTYMQPVFSLEQIFYLKEEIRGRERFIAGLRGESPNIVRADLDPVVEHIKDTLSNVENSKLNLRKQYSNQESDDSHIEDSTPSEKDYAILRAILSSDVRCTEEMQRRAYALGFGIYFLKTYNRALRFDDIPSDNASYGAFKQGLQGETFSEEKLRSCFFIRESDINNPVKRAELMSSMEISDRLNMAFYELGQRLNEQVSTNDP